MTRNILFCRRDFFFPHLLGLLRWLSPWRNIRCLCVIQPRIWTGSCIVPISPSDININHIWYSGLTTCSVSYYKGLVPVRVASV
ncbi:uncharacterized protein YALI1_D07930g [Yarrowia lipolytica]|uniref:Uncharacterized protein n=1 Tax=Yarrowia lipolytica TaxID=4952 RepID=A0A1D8NDF2_YARLL|nr:hypothetical protein YALI1_D07930g [Yarrowia lipolytica]